MASLLSIFFPDVWHRFFFFLGTHGGNFFKNSVELVVFLLLSYMVISEYLKTFPGERKQELSFLLIAFLSFLIHKTIEVVIYANIVFGNFALESINNFWPVMNKFFGLISLILLLHAFIYPAFRAKQHKFGYDLKVQLFFAFFIAFAVEAFWFFQQNKNDFHDFWGNHVFVAVQFLLIGYALYEMLAHSTPDFSYRGNIFLAFWVYLMLPIVQIANILFFGNGSVRLRLLEEPFPVFALILLTQVTYLKLVDRVYWRERLYDAEKKYRIEKELGEMKDDFVSVVSHELRTPITSIKLYLSLLNSGKFGRLVKKQQEALGIVKSESDRLSSLIEDILNLSKLEAKKTELQITDFNVEELKNPIYYASAREKGIKVFFSMPKGFTVKADAQKFTQVFINLLGNAIKFTEPDGKITISVKDLRDEWALSIADTGRGIPKEDIPRLFDKFYQVESHMTRTKGGTGLGLAIAKNIVDLHKGRIEVESGVGKGSRFGVYMPKNL